jgi:uncharacterized protein (DUF58 family)
MNALVPHPKLLLFAALVVVPCLTLAVSVPSLQTPTVVLLIVFVLLVALDATSAHESIRDLAVSMPETVRMSVDRDESLSMTVSGNSGPSRRSIRIGLPVPVDALRLFEEIQTVRLSEADSHRVPWSCHALARGRHMLSACCLEGQSRMGLWLGRRQLPLSTEVRVYPNINNERKPMAAFFLRREGLGAHAQRQVGKGRDFEKLREYVPGDGYDEIHWKATAKRGSPITKVFQVERTQEVYIAIDSSRLSARQSVTGGGATYGDPALDRYITAALVMAMVTQRMGDMFGLITFSDKVHTLLRARGGRDHFNACREALYELQPDRVSPDFQELATTLRLRLRRRALIIFLTALDDPILAESFAESMTLINRQHLILVNVMPPNGTAQVFSNPAVDDAGDVYSALAGHLRWHDLQALQGRLHRQGVPLHVVDDARLCPQLVSQYMTVKARQQL